MRAWTFYWSDGSREVYRTGTFNKALKAAGYQGALSDPALERTFEGEDHSLIYVDGKWVEKSNSQN